MARLSFSSGVCSVSVENPAESGMAGAPQPCSWAGEQSLPGRTLGRFFPIAGSWMLFSKPINTPCSWSSSPAQQGLGLYGNSSSTSQLTFLLCPWQAGSGAATLNELFTRQKQALAFPGTPAQSCCCCPGTHRASIVGQLCLLLPQILSALN